MSKFRDRPKIRNIATERGKVIIELQNELDLKATIIQNKEQRIKELEDGIKLACSKMKYVDGLPLPRIVKILERALKGE